MTPAMITNRFIDGLREDIRFVVMMQSPVDLDTASSLALLQVEVFGDFMKRNVKKAEFVPLVKHTWKMPQSTFTPTSKNFGSAVPTENTRNSNYTRASHRQSSENKLSALMAYRKAKGLCY